MVSKYRLEIFGVGVLDKPVQAFTGLKTAHGILGYSATGQITLTQNSSTAYDCIRLGI